MARRPSIALLIIVALAFFLFGLYSVAIGNGSNSSGATVTPTRSPGSLQQLRSQETSTTFLVLGVDDLSSSQARLKAIWYVSFGYPSKDIFLLGLSPSLTPPGSQRPLHDSFNWNPGQGVSAGFAEQLANAVPLEISGTVVLDEQGFASLIDYLGGVDVSSSHFDGEQVLGILSFTDDDPEDTLQMQKRLLEAMADRASLLGHTPEITELIELMPDHLYSSVSTNRAVMLIAPLLPIQTETTHIETY